MPSSPEPGSKVGVMPEALHKPAIPAQCARGADQANDLISSTIGNSGLEFGPGSGRQAGGSAPACTMASAAESSWACGRRWAFRMRVRRRKQRSWRYRKGSTRTTLNARPSGKQSWLQPRAGQWAMFSTSTEKSSSSSYALATAFGARSMGPAVCYEPLRTAKLPRSFAPASPTTFTNVRSSPRSRRAVGLPMHGRFSTAVFWEKSVQPVLRPPTVDAPTG